MSDSCECGDIESCILCRFRQTYISAADAWQAGLAMVKECEALHEENQRLRERVGELEKALKGIADHNNTAPPMRDWLHTVLYPKGAPND